MEEHDEVSRIGNALVLVPEKLVEKASSNDMFSKRLTPKGILAKLDEVVIGQDAAKKKLTAAAMMHLFRYGRKLRKEEVSAAGTYKTDVLLTGPTGVGKTLMLETMAKILNLPFIRIDATKITPEGYIGGKAEGSFVQGVQDVVKKGQGEFLEGAIVFIDEIDKLCLLDGESDFYKRAQSSMLKIVEGTEIKYKDESNYMRYLDTSRMLFVFGGNFEKVRTARDVIDNKNVLGFTAVKETSAAKDIDIHEEVMKAGLMPELAGRISVIAELFPLTKEQVKKVILHSKASVYLEFVETLNAAGIKAKLTNKQIDGLVESAMKKKTGMRGIGSAVAAAFESIILNHKY